MNPRRPTIAWVYVRLFASYGPQHWWPGDTPFEVMVGAVLTQNAAWVNVTRALSNLKRARALSVRRIAEAEHATLAEWLRPSGYFNVKAKRLQSFCAWLQRQGGMGALRQRSTPELRQALLAVHGIGPETADDILLYALARPVFVIDAYTRRIFSRLGIVQGKEGYESLRAVFERETPASVERYNEYHALIVRHGKDVCRVRPRCEVCALSARCPSAIRKPSPGSRRPR